jgi:ComF family protein
MRRPTSSCSHGESSGAARCQRRAAAGAMVGGCSCGMKRERKANEYIDPMLFRRFADGLSAALPSQCAVCRAWPAQAVCEPCVARFAQPQARCGRCAIPVPAGVAQCGRCIASPPPLDACHAAVSYAFPWSALIAQYKFNGQAGWARAFGTLMRSAPWIEPALDEADVVVAMPLSAERLAERGFNQSLQLARQLAGPKTDPTLLLRVRNTPSQAALDRQARLANVSGAFALDPARAVQVNGRRVVIVDDVMTSGASLFGAALVLRQAGAAKVTGLVLARTDEPH